MIYTHCNLYRNRNFVNDCWIEVEDGKIIALGEMKYLSTDIIKEYESLNGALLVPGFIDQHVHGAVGADFMDAKIQNIKKILMYLATEGVTSVLATTTADESTLTHALETISAFEDEGGVEVIGIHLEGPYLSPKAAGAHQSSLFVKPTIEHFNKLQTYAQNKIKMVTLAVEEDEGHALITYLRKHNIVASIGHSVATYDEAADAFEAGCQCVTHCYNAMSGLNHREPGVVGLTLGTDGLKAELIADGIHVSSGAIRVFERSKLDEDIILITDAMRAKGLPKGYYDLGGQMVYASEDRVRTEEGNLAGSILKLPSAINNYCYITGKTLAEVLPMVTENPARLHGVWHRKGSIEINKDADLVVLSPDGQVLKTICRGKEVYNK